MYNLSKWVSKFGNWPVFCCFLLFSSCKNLCDSCMWKDVDFRTALRNKSHNFYAKSQTGKLEVKLTEIFLLFTPLSHTCMLNEPSPLWKVKNLCCMTLAVTARFPRALLLDYHCLVLRQCSLTGWPPAATLGQPGLTQTLHYCCSQETTASVYQSLHG